MTPETYGVSSGACEVVDFVLGCQGREKEEGDPVYNVVDEDAVMDVDTKEDESL